MKDKAKPPYVITVANLKGGAGKSTVTVTIACAFHRDGVKTLIVDADSQGSLRTWAGAGTGNDIPPVPALDGRNIAKDLLRIGASYELVVVDTPPRMPAESRIAMVAADLVLIPSEPGATDLWALKEMLATVEEARAMRPNLLVYVLPNRIDATNMSDLVRKELALLDVPLLKAQLGSRVAFREAMAAGCDVVALDPNSEAAREAHALHRELAKIIKEKNR
jgi:chromosome partitioning protein